MAYGYDIGIPIFTNHTLLSQQNEEKNYGSHSHRSFCVLKKLIFKKEKKEM
jgi:hypothetical protein